MRRVALRGLARAQAPRRPHGDRDRPRRRDGERHARPHRHDREGVRLDLRELLRADGRRRLAARSSSSASQTRQGAGLAGACSRRCAALPEVDAAAGTILDLSGDSNQAKILDKNGKAIAAAATRPSASASTRRGQRFNPLQARRRALGGRARTRSSIDPDTADETGLRGRRHDQVAARRARSARSRSPASPASATSTRSAARRSPSSTSRRPQALLRKAGFDAISVAARQGVAPGAARSTRSRTSLPASRRGAHRRRAGRPRTRKGVGEFVNFIRYFLLGFGGIALFVGAFVIFNTLSITVAQRTRELATLRTLGASRRQVLRSVRARGSRASASSRRRSASGSASAREGTDGAVPAPSGSTCRRPATVFATADLSWSRCCSGTLVTLVAGICAGACARRASPPIAAVREGADAAEAASRKRSSRSALVVIGARVVGLVGTACSASGRLERRVRCSDRRSARSRCLHRHGAARAAARPPARAVVGAARRAPRRRGRPARERERDPQPGPHGVDRRGADDRPRARHVRRRARQGAARLDRRAPIEKQVERRLRRHARRTAGTRSRPRPAAARAAPGVRSRPSIRSDRGPARRRQARSTSAASTRRPSARVYHFELEARARRGRRSHARRRARSSRRRSRRTTACASASRSRCSRPPAERAR